MFIFYFLGVGLPCRLMFLSVLVVREGSVYLPTPPSWFSPFSCSFDLFVFYLGHVSLSPYFGSLLVFVSRYKEELL